MQHLKDNFPRALPRALLVTAAILGGARAIAADQRPDPLLHAAPQNACQAGADYVAGVDTAGHAVVPADAGGAKVPVPGQIVMPLPGHRRGYVVLDGRKLEPLLNPKPCN
jgi:hypothetical protein